MQSGLDGFLEYVYKDRVSFPAETRELKALQSAVESFVAKIVSKVSRYPRFLVRETINCGSYYDGSKVRVPNQFDYFVILDQLSDGACDVFPSKHGFGDKGEFVFLKVNKENRKTWRDVTRENYLVCSSGNVSDESTMGYDLKRNIVKLFRGLCEGKARQISAVRNKLCTLGFHSGTNCGSRGVRLHFDITWNITTTIHVPKHITVDLTPAIKFPLSKWLLQENLPDILLCKHNKGRASCSSIYLIAGTDSLIKPEISWKIVCPPLEKELIDDLPVNYFQSFKLLKYFIEKSHLNCAPFALQANDMKSMLFSLTVGGIFDEPPDLDVNTGLGMLLVFFLEKLTGDTQRKTLSKHAKKFTPRNIDGPESKSWENFRKHLTLKGLEYLTRRIQEIHINWKARTLPEKEVEVRSILRFLRKVPETFDLFFTAYPSWSRNVNTERIKEALDDFFSEALKGNYEDPKDALSSTVKTKLHLSWRLSNTVASKVMFKVHNTCDKDGWDSDEERATKAFNTRYYRAPVVTDRNTPGVTTGVTGKVFAGYSTFNVIPRGERPQLLPLTGRELKVQTRDENKSANFTIEVQGKFRCNERKYVTDDARFSMQTQGWQHQKRKHRTRPPKLSATGSQSMGINNFTENLQEKQHVELNTGISGNQGDKTDNLIGQNENPPHDGSKALLNKGMERKEEDKRKYESIGRIAESRKDLDDQETRFKQINKSLKLEGKPQQIHVKKTADKTEEKHDMKRLARDEGKKITRKDLNAIIDRRVNARNLHQGKGLNTEEQTMPQRQRIPKYVLPPLEMKKKEIPFPLS